MSRHSREQTWLHWLIDLAIGISFGVVVVVELIFGVPHPWVLVAGSLLLLPLVGLHLFNLMTALTRPAVLTWIDRFRFSIPAVAGGAVAISISRAAKPPAVAFFETCAQLIPLIAVALAIEGRLFAGPRFRVPLVFGTFVMLGVGEFLCLRAIATQQTGVQVFSFVGATLAFAFVALILVAVLGPADAEPPAARPLFRPRK